MIDFNHYFKEAQFSKTIKMLRGDVPHVNSLAIITAQNPMGKKVSAAENNKRNKSLLRDLKSSNFSPIKVGNAFIRQMNAVELKGKFLGNIEDSFIIPHVNKDVAIYLARKYEQLAVIWGEKKHSPDVGDYIHFEWIEATNPNDVAQPYLTTQTRDIVIAGQEASSRNDNYSALKLPDSGEVPDTHKMVIPFFDPVFSNAKYANNKRTIDLGDERPDWNYKKSEYFYIPFFDDMMEGIRPELEITEDISFYKEELPDTPEVQKAIDSIKDKVEFLKERNLSGRSYWAALGSLNEEIRKLKIII